MQRNNSIFLIDDHEERRHDLSVILEFLGEPVIAIPSRDWRKIDVNPQHLLTVILGECAQSDSASTIIDTFEEWGVKPPVLQLGSTPLPPLYEDKIQGFIDEPLQYQQVLDLLQHCQIIKEQNQTHSTNNDKRPVTLFRSLIGVNPATRQLRELMDQVVQTDLNVMILGEADTGKEVVARNIHYYSKRREKPFVGLNCAAMDPDQLDREFFGTRNTPGYLEKANHGTVFLDEIDVLPLSCQAKFLRIAQDRVLELTDSTDTKPLDIRFIVATHRNLETALTTNMFREDLYFRFNEFALKTPALRERLDDLPLLLNELVTRMETQQDASIKFKQTAVDALSKYNWPGNMRELANLVDHLAHVYGSTDHEIDYLDLPGKFHVASLTSNEEQDPLHHGHMASFVATDLPDDGINLKAYIANIEQVMIEQALNKCGRVVTRTAKYLNMRRTTLLEKMRKYGIKRKQD